MTMISVEPSGRRSRNVRTADVVVGSVCAVIALVMVSVAVEAFGVTWSEQARLWLLVLVSIIVPGALITRRFPAGGVVAKLSVAFGAGVGAQLLSWVLAIATGWDFLLWIVPVVFAAAWVAADRRWGDRVLRRPARRRRGEPPVRSTDTTDAADDADATDLQSESGVVSRVLGLTTRTPWWASLTLLAAWWLTLRSLTRTYWAVTPLDGGLRWYQDLFWHLSLSAEMTHRVPPADPQSAADGTLNYHWFSNAHGAALAMGTGVDLVKVTILFWIIPTIAATIGLVYGLAAYLAKTPAAGCFGVLALALSPATVVQRGIDSGANSALVWASPSHMFSLPFMLLLVWMIVLALRPGSLSWGSLALLFYFFLLSPGSKVSMLPTVLGGVGVAWLAALVMRRPAWRIFAVGVLGSVVVVATLPLFGGGGDGSAYTTNATVTQLQIWKRSVAEQVPLSPAITVLLMLGLIATFVYLVILAPLFDRSDPAPWLYLGMLAVAFLAMFVVKHPSLSQIYFMRGLSPVTAAFVGWGLAVAASRLSTVVGRPIGALGVGAAGVVGVALGWRWMTSSQFQRYRLLHFKWLLALVAVVLLAAIVVVIVQRLRRPAVMVAGSLAAVVILGFSVAPGARAAIKYPTLRLETATSFGKLPSLNHDEIAAAARLAAANPEGDLVATNVHCRLVRTTPHCDARGFWVSALSQSPVFIGGWAYSASGRASGDSHYNYQTQSYFEPRLFALNEAVFAAPTAANVAQLRDHGVRYLYADQRASTVSPALANFASVVWSSPTVTVYRMR